MRVLEANTGTVELNYPVTEHKVLEVFSVYNYFCLKLNCFEAFFGRDKGVIKDCPICGMNDKVVARFV
jgi:hypothetical protein